MRIENTRRVCAAALLSASLGACGREPSPPPTPSTAQPVIAQSPPPVPLAAAPSTAAPPEKPHAGAKEPDLSPKLRLGHYSSVDGLFGMVLDRTHGSPRGAVDGSDEVIDFAIRRRGRGVAFVATRRELALEISEYGQVTAYTDAREEMVLRRDADALPLAAPPAPSVDAAAIKALDARAKERCQANVRFEVLGTPSAAALRGFSVSLERATQAVAKVCRDGIGRGAVQKKLHAVRIAHAEATAMTLEGGVLTVRGDLEGEALGPFFDEIHNFLRATL